MENREVLMNRLDRLSRHVRTAFAIGCAERVLCLDELDRGSDDPRINAAVALCWSYAGGEEPDLEELDTAEDMLREAIPNLNERNSGGPAYAACMALVFALDAIVDPSAESAVSSAFSALEAIDMYEDYLESESQTWSAAEHEWQMRALSVCESVRGVVASRNLFDALGSRPPEWFRARD